jgi:hypothetical protein
VTGNRNPQTDRSSAMVTAGMLLLALLGVITVFHEPIAAIFVPAASEPPPPLPGDERGAVTPPVPAPTHAR